MPLYRFLFLTDGGPVPVYTELSCEDDARALARAEALAVTCDIEIWHDGRFVAQVPRATVDNSKAGAA